MRQAAGRTEGDIGDGMASSLSGQLPLQDGDRRGAEVRSAGTALSSGGGDGAGRTARLGREGLRERERGGISERISCFLGPNLEIEDWSTDGVRRAEPSKRQKRSWL